MTQSHWILIGTAVWILAIIAISIWAKYFRKEPSSGSSGVGNALLELQSMLEPDKKIVIEMRQEEKSDEKVDGAPEKPEEDVE